MQSELKLESGEGEVSAILDLPEKPRGALTLAHGAGAGMNHKFLAELAPKLAQAGFAVLRFQFPYMEAGKKRVDSPKIAVATVAAAVERLAAEVPGVPLFAAGKSFGSRMSTTGAAEGAIPQASGLICFGFPLHPPGELGTKRAEHLTQVKIPILFLQGDRDEFAELPLLKGVLEKLPKAKLHVIRGGDHGFAVLKSSGRKAGEVMDELVAESAKFARI